jgi:MFS family permease
MAVPGSIEMASAPRTAVVTASSKYVLLALTLAFAGIAIDTQVVLTPMTNVLAQDLRLTSSEVSWVINALALGGAVSVGLTARLGDMIGPRRVLIPLAGAGVLGALLCLAADGFWLMAIGRFLTGLGVATPLGWAMIRPRATETQLRHVALLLGSVIALFTPVNLILGGVLLKAGADWRMVFVVVAVAYALLFVLALLSPEAPASSRKRVPLDVLGTVGLAVWLTTMLLAISQGTTWGWGSATILSLGAVAVVTFILWVFQQRRAPAPLMAFRGADTKQLVAGYMGQSALNAPASVLFVLVPIMLQLPKQTGFGLGQDQLHSTLPLIMILPSALLSAVISRFALERFGPKVPLVVGSATGAIGFVGLAFVHSEVWNFYVWVSFYAMGLLTCANVGYALAAAGGRQDNMSITFGVQFIGGQLLAAIVTAVVLVILDPAGGAMTEGTFTGIFLAVAIGLGLFAAGCALLGPRQIVDQHAVDAMPVITPPIAETLPANV